MHYIHTPTHRFYLKKNRGSPTKQKTKFILFFFRGNLSAFPEFFLHNFLSPPPPPKARSAEGWEVGEKRGVCHWQTFKKQRKGKNRENRLVRPFPPSTRPTEKPRGQYWSIDGQDRRMQAFGSNCLPATRRVANRVDRRLFALDPPAPTWWKPGFFFNF